MKNLCNTCSKKEQQCQIRKAVGGGNLKICCDYQKQIKLPKNFGKEIEDKFWSR